jgi:hypothetical protein
MIVDEHDARQNAFRQCMFDLKMELLTSDYQAILFAVRCALNSSLYWQDFARIDHAIEEAGGLGHFQIARDLGLISNVDWQLLVDLRDVAVGRRWYGQMLGR